MKSKRRDFIKLTRLTSLDIAGSGIIAAFGENFIHQNKLHSMVSDSKPTDDADLSVIGLYDAWTSALTENKLPALSFRRNEWKNIDAWRKIARSRLIERLAIPHIEETPGVTVKKKYEFNGLHVEELSWQLPYGRATEAILLKPLNAKEPLPGILAFHDHGGNKYFGTRKITRTSNQQHPLMQEHQKEYYEGMAWANEIAGHEYVVLVCDAFPFASRRVMLQDVPSHLREGLNDDNPEEPKNIKAYNEWARQHEHIMTKSLFSAGTTWPAVFFAEDKKALDILCARKDVDAHNVGCAGLSGGSMRTVFMAGLDRRIKCAVCVGFMTTWKDFLLHKSYTHTWMAYVPLLPNELDFPEILALRAPLATLVLNDENDELYTPMEMRRADKILSEVYAKAGASNKYKCSFYPGPHKFDKAMQAEAFNWFDQWLKV